MNETQHTPDTQAACLTAVRDRGTATLSEVASATGLSRPTVTSVLAGLESTGLVTVDTEPAPAGQRGGRPARRYTFEPDGGLVLGIDVSTAEARVLVSDLAGRVLAVSAPGQPSPDNTHPGLDRVTTLVEKTLAGAGRRLEEVRAVGLGVAGLVDDDGVLLGSPTVRSWKDVAIGRELAALLGAPVVPDNDLVLAASAEAALGGLAGAHAGVYTLTWHHVSARITIDGEVLRGRHQRAGEVGLLNTFQGTTVPEGDLLTGVRAVAASLRRLRENPDDAEGAATVQQLTASMTPAVAALVLAVDPDVVILGGALGAFADVIAPRLAESVRDFASGFVLDAEITGSALGDLAVPLGALQAAFRRCPEQVYGVAHVPAPGLRLDTLTGV